MKIEDYVNAKRLTGSSMTDRRKELKKELIKNNIQDCSNPFTLDELARTCQRETDLTFEDTTIRESLMEFEGVYVDHIGEDKYKIIKPPDLDDFDSIIDPVWREYEDFLNLFKNGEVDPYYSSQIRPAFKDFFREFFSEITESVEELNEYQKESIYTTYGRTEELVENVIGRHDVPENSVFRDSIKEYLNDPGEELLTFTEKVYTTAVNKDLLSKEEEYVDFPSIPKTNRKLVLDTNVLVPLLANSVDLHPLVSSVCHKSRDMDFDLHYTSNTADELDDLIEGSNDQMTGVHSGQKEFKLTDSDNQFVDDYNNKPDVGWSEYYSDLKNWRENVEEEYGITEIEFDKRPNETIKKITQEKLLEGSGDMMHPNAFNRLQHDSNLLATVAEHRQYSDWSFGPFVITAHHNLAEIGKTVASDRETRDIVGRRPLALQPRGWLNYLISFSSVDFESQDRKQLSIAILQTASDFKETMDIDEYVHHFAPKVDVDVEKEDNLKELLVNHPLSEQLEDAVENDQGHRAERISREILTDKEYLERIDEERDFEKRIREASEKIEQLESQVDELRKGSSEESESLNQKSESAFRRSYRETYTKIRSTLPRDLDDTQFSKPPKHNSDLSEIKQWLQVTTATIASSDNIPDEVEDLNSELEELLADSIRLSS